MGALAGCRKCTHGFSRCSSWQVEGEFMMKQMILPALALLASAPAFAQPAGPADDYVPEMRDAVAAAALPPPAMDARLMPAAADGAALPPGWKPATAESWAPATAQSWQQQAPAVQNQGWQQGWQQPPPVQVVHTRTVVPVPVPVAYGGWGGPAYGVPIGWGGGWNRGWNRGWRGGGWNGGWGPGVVIGGGWGGGYGGWNRGYGRGWGRCRGTGGGALVGGIAGASIGYGLGNRWDRTPGVIIGGLVGALAGSAIERSGC
jgi:hypothetical protein